MSDPVRLELYRERPKPLPLRAREHAPVCTWCRWQRGIINDHYCGEPRHNPSGSHSMRFATTYINLGQCDWFSATLATRILQRLGLRPFVERIRK